MNMDGMWQKMYEIVATSAFRDSENSEKARRYVENKINHPIRIISGLEEAKLIPPVIRHLHGKMKVGPSLCFVGPSTPR